MSYLDAKPDFLITPFIPGLEGDNPDAPELEIRVRCADSTVWFEVATPGLPTTICEVALDYWHGKVVLMKSFYDDEGEYPEEKYETLYDPRRDVK